MIPIISVEQKIMVHKLSKTELWSDAIAIARYILENQPGA